MDRQTSVNQMNPLDSVDHRVQQFLMDHLTAKDPVYQGLMHHQALKNLMVHQSYMNLSISMNLAHQWKLMDQEFRQSEKKPLPLELMDL